MSEVSLYIKIKYKELYTITTHFVNWVDNPGADMQLPKTILRELVKLFSFK